MAARAYDVRLAQDCGVHRVAGVLIQRRAREDEVGSIRGQWESLPLVRAEDLGSRERPEGVPEAGVRSSDPSASPRSRVASSTTTRSKKLSPAPSSNIVLARAMSARRFTCQASQVFRYFRAHCAAERSGKCSSSMGVQASRGTNEVPLTAWFPFPTTTPGCAR